jgi:tRNA (guanine37-N1)-methyltransferase
MAIIKVPIQKAQISLEFAREKKIFDEKYSVKKEKDQLLFSVTDESLIKNKFDFVSIVDNKKLDKAERKETNLKEALVGKLNEKEMQLLVTAFDVIGDMAVIEIPLKLRKKEKIIAKEILEINHNIQTVLRKQGMHKGKYRTQKLKFLAGKNKKQTIHKENNILLKLDLEKIYFSTRSSNERKRVASLVKDGENVLVMFSGCSPFVCVIAKNTGAQNVFGIELNPIAHEYGVENVKLNNLRNAYLIKGDVKKIVPDFYRNIIGLKSGLNKKEMKTRLVKKPKIMEIYLHTEELYEKLGELERTIKDLQKKEIEVIMHMPFNNLEKQRISMDKENVEEDLKILYKLGDLCIKYGINAIIHPYQPSEKSTKNQETFVQNLRKLKKYFNYFYFENDSTSEMFGTGKQMMQTGKDTGIKKICFDTCHSFMLHKNNDKLIEDIKMLKESDLYFHMADSNGESHGDAIGKGKIDFDKILTFVKKGIIEVTSEDEMKAKQMLDSYEKIMSKQKKFDRILMPLPKSAQSFLKEAFMASKKGTIIHYYDFLTEEEIPDKATSEIKKEADKAGKKIKIIDCVKCGTYSPKTFRTCTDFEVLN